MRLEVPSLPEFEDAALVTEGRGWGSTHALLVAFDRLLDDSYEPLAGLAPPGYPQGVLIAIDAGLAVRASDRPQTIAGWRAVLLHGAEVSPSGDQGHVGPAAGERGADVRADGSRPYDREPHQGSTKRAASRFDRGR